MKANKHPMRWPARLIDSEGAEPGPELQPEIQTELQSLLRVCADEPGPSEGVTGRAARKAVAHFEALESGESGAGRMGGWLAATLRPGRIALALAVVLLLPVGAALASKLSPGGLWKLGDWLMGRHAVRSSERSPPPQIPSAPIPSISPAPELVAPSTETIAPIVTAERAPRRRETSPAPATRLPSPPAADLLAGEASLVSHAVALANDNPRAALDLLAGYWRQFPDGALRGEAAEAELSARLSLGETAEALARLDGFAQDGFRGMKGTADELRVARLELMAGAGRCSEALPLLEKELSGLAWAPGLRGRALLARAACKANAGDEAGNRADLKLYLSEFPDGPRAAKVRRALGE